MSSPFDQIESLPAYQGRYAPAQAARTQAGGLAASLEAAGSGGKRPSGGRAGTGTARGMYGLARALACGVAAGAAAPALASPVASATGPCLEFVFDLRGARHPPLPPFTGVTLVLPVDAATGDPAPRLRWQVLDAAGTRLWATDDTRTSHDLFHAGVRGGVFAVRLQWSTGSVQGEPMASGFRDYGREIGTLISELRPSVSQRPCAAASAGSPLPVR